MIGGRIHGEAKLRRKLGVIERRVELVSPVAVGAGAKVLEQQMHRFAPVLTGRLRARVHTDIATNRDGATARTGSDVPYDPFVQGGTVYMEPQAYGEEASNEGASAIVAAMAGVYRKALP